MNAKLLAFYAVLALTFGSFDEVRATSTKATPSRPSENHVLNTQSDSESTTQQTSNTTTATRKTTAANTAAGRTTRSTTPVRSTSLKTTAKTKTNTGKQIMTTTKPAKTCEQRNDSCSSCTDDSSCFWCSSDKSCKHKKSKLIPRHCSGNKWYWKQCRIRGDILIIAIPTVAGVLLIMLGCCIFFCCCRRRGKSNAEREQARQRQNRQDRQQRNEERQQNRKARHDAIRLKYGLLQNEDDDLSTDPLA